MAFSTYVFDMHFNSSGFKIVSLLVTEEIFDETINGLLDFVSCLFKIQSLLIRESNLRSMTILLLSKMYSHLYSKFEIGIYSIFTARFFFCPIDLFFTAKIVH